MAKIPGVYVPSFYEHQYNPDGTLAAILPQEGAPQTVTKRIVQDLDKVYFPTQMIVPSTEIVHDRANLEVFRGCIRGCRFCQAGFSCRPVRKKSPQVLYRQAVETLEHSGFNEITISSLSTSDYRGLKELTDELIPYCADRKINLSVPSLRADNFSRELMEKISSLSTSDYRGLKELTDELIPYCADRKINLSVPSLRADNFSRELMEKLQAVRKTGLTFAPEAGTQRLRDVINKNLTEEEILSTCTQAFQGGWNSVKLYFMLGLPTETDEDVLGIAELVYKVIQAWKEHAVNKKRGLRVHVATAFQGGWNSVKLYFMLGLPTETDEDVLGIAELVYKVIQAWKEHAVNKKRGLRVHVATAYFVPKPHTPFQWEQQITPQEYLRRCRLLKSHFYSKSIVYDYHSPDLSRLEAVFARGFQWEQQITPQEYLRRCRLLKSHFYSKSIVYDYHSPDLSRLEAVFARGDRRLGPVLEAAVASGARLDGWDEYFNYSKWFDAFQACGVDPDFYTTRGYGEEEILPWDPIDVGVSKRFLLRERHQAYAGVVTPDCRHGCSGCGANALLKEVACDA